MQTPFERLPPPIDEQGQPLAVRMCVTVTVSTKNGSAPKLGLPTDAVDMFQDLDMSDDEAKIADKGRGARGDKKTAAAPAKAKKSTSKDKDKAPKAKAGGAITDSRQGTKLPIAHTRNNRGAQRM